MIWNFLSIKNCIILILKHDKENIWLLEILELYIYASVGFWYLLGSHLILSFFSYWSDTYKIRISHILLEGTKDLFTFSKRTIWDILEISHQRPSFVKGRSIGTSHLTSNSNAVKYMLARTEMGGNRSRLMLCNSYCIN